MEVICTEFLTNVKLVIRYGAGSFTLMLVYVCTISFVNLNINMDLIHYIVSVKIFLHC